VKLNAPPVRALKVPVALDSGYFFDCSRLGKMIFSQLLTGYCSPANIKRKFNSRLEKMSSPITLALADKGHEGSA